MYEILVTAVSERADLFVESMRSLLQHVDVRPIRFIVHEDVRPGSAPGEIGRWLGVASLAGNVSATHRTREPAGGMGPAFLWCFEQARTDIVLYTQEDWGAVRDLPVAAALDLMRAHDLNHIRFNKRKTLRAKHADTDHPWHKVEVVFGDQVLCISDHWHTTPSLWRVAAALPAVRIAAARSSAAHQFVPALNQLINESAGLRAKDTWNDQQLRHERIKTYIWGPIGEPAFVKHLGSSRGTGKIKDHLAPDVTHR